MGKQAAPDDGDDDHGDDHDGDDGDDHDGDGDDDVEQSDERQAIFFYFFRATFVLRYVRLDRFLKGTSPFEKPRGLS